RRTSPPPRARPARQGRGGCLKPPPRWGAAFSRNYPPAPPGPKIRPPPPRGPGARLYANALNPLAHAGSGLDGAVRITAAQPCYELVSADLPATCALLARTLEPSE